MILTAVDTSVIIAALLAWHECHDPALNSLTALIDDGTIVLPAPALTESYAVMTRLPSPHRLSPGDAEDLLSGSFEGRARVVGLSEKEHWRFVHEAAGNGTSGGATYDALILACALKGRASRILTFDRRDFVRLATTEIEVMVP